MSTPAMAFASCARTVIFSFLAIWIFTLTVSRVWTFHNALQSEITKRKNESWLVQQCNDPEFYFNLKEHTDLCATVISNANSNAVLNALYSMATSTHLCGTTTCTDALQALMQRLGWQVVGLAFLIALFSPNVLFLLYRSSMRKHTRNKEFNIMASTHKQGMLMDPKFKGWSPYYGPTDICSDWANEKDAGIRHRHAHDDTTATRDI